MSQSSSRLARCSTTLLVVLVLAGLALNFLGNVVVPHAPLWVTLPVLFLSLFLMIFCAAELGHRIRAHRRSR